MACLADSGHLLLTLKAFGLILNSLSPPVLSEE